MPLFFTHTMRSCHGPRPRRWADRPGGTRGPERRAARARLWTLGAPRGGAFTLIELLVVITIIGLLVAILLPSLAAARKQARSLVCLTQQRNVGIAWQLYYQDNNQAFIPSYTNIQWFYGGNEPCLMENTTGESPYAYTQRPLNPYVGQATQGASGAATFHCPLDGGVLDPMGNPHFGPTAYAYFGNSYMLNGQLISPTAVKSAAGQTIGYADIGTKDVSVTASLLILLGDCQWYYSVCDSGYSAKWHGNNDRMNITFMDGHAQFTQIIRGQEYTSTYSTLRDPPPLPPPAQ
jgi:prepilin-type N-terminal cleavage/methylation domain-containing protein/prepilin-type processing-associated H-X9-DG protein